jgi:hypothetical protein
VTVSIIIDNNDGASSKCRVENEEDGNDEGDGLGGGREARCLDLQAKSHGKTSF